MKSRKLYDWLIIVFLHEIQTDLNYSDAMKDAIAKAGCGENICVFLIQDSVSTDEATHEYSFRLSVSKLDLQEDGSFAYIPVLNPHLRIINKHKNCWEDAFRWIYSNYFGERNMLITYSEGAAFGINAEQQKIVRPAAPTAPDGFIDLPTDLGQISMNKYYVMDEKSMHTLTTDHDFKLAKPITQQQNVWMLERDPNMDICKNLEVLWISQLASALNRYLFGANVDIFLMNNCYMQLFDNGYSLSSKVKFLVAAEGAMSMVGYDFGKLMHTLNTCPAIPSDDLVRQVLADLQELYKNDPTATSTATVFGNRLKFYPLALRVFEDLLDELEPLLPIIAVQLEEIRSEMKNVTNNPNYPLVDAGLWVKLVAEKILGLEGAPYYYKIFSELQSKIVIGNLVSPVIRAVDAGGGPQYGYTGISIYYPLDNQMHENQEVVWCAYFDKAIPAPFRSHSRWNKFLNEYFRALKKIETPA